MGRMASWPRLPHAADLALPRAGWPPLPPARAVASRGVLRPSSTWRRPPCAPPPQVPGGVYAAHRHRRERGAHAHGGDGAGAGAKKRASLSPPPLCFIGSTVLLAIFCHKEKGSCLGSFWRISLAPVAYTPTPKPQGVKYELHTLPVDAKAVTDGDTITVYVDTADHPESCNVPQEVHRVAVERAKDYQRADALQKIILDAGYRQVPNLRGEQVLVKKYWIRLRGIDAPDNSMHYGRGAKEELVKLVQGKALNISIYDNDRYGRLVGDIDCNGAFVQEHMLKKGLAWHCTAYDQRLELAKWENHAKASRMGLWALLNPEKPWEWRRGKRIGIV